MTQSEALDYHSPRSDGSLESVPDGVYSPTLSSDSSEGETPSLRSLSLNPNQEEIDSWIEELKHHRTIQTKTGARLPAIQCPLPACGKPQRRPQALRVSDMIFNVYALLY